MDVGFENIFVAAIATSYSRIGCKILGEPYMQHPAIIALLCAKPNHHNAKAPAAPFTSKKEEEEL
jgi:hypothetical protein